MTDIVERLNGAAEMRGYPHNEIFILAATELTRARSEIARLREALTKVVATASPDYWTSEGAHEDAVYIARLALSPDKEGK